MNRIIFLGSGGGRQMCASQMRKTGGMYFEFGQPHEEFGFSLDPGPGALVHAISLGLDPVKWKGVVVSHHHIDHTNDMNVIIDAISTNEKKEKSYPFVIAEEQLITEGRKDAPYPYLTKYHSTIVKKAHALKHGESVMIGKVEFVATKALHYAPNNGYVIKCDKLKIGYPADGSYYPGQEKQFECCDVLILNCPWPKGHDAPKNIHMTLDDAIALVKAIKEKPKLVVLSHLSPLILRSNLFKQEKIFMDATKVRCISAEDFMEIDLDTLKTRILHPVQK